MGISYLFDQAREDVSSWVESNHPTREAGDALDAILVKLHKDIASAKGST